MTTDRFTLRPITAADAQIDHAAVMESRDYPPPGPDGDRWEDGDVVDFWVRRSQLADGTDGELLAALRAWLPEVWRLDRYVVVTNEQFTQQVALIESTDLTPRFHIDEPDKPGRYLAYA